MSPLVVFSSSSSPSSESSGSVFPVSPVFPAFPVSPACRKPHQKPKAVLRKQAQENRRKEKKWKNLNALHRHLPKKSGERVCVCVVLFYTFYTTDGLWVLGGKSVLNLQLIHNIFFSCGPNLLLTINPYNQLYTYAATQKTKEPKTRLRKNNGRCEFEGGNKEGDKRDEEIPDGRRHSRRLSRHRRRYGSTVSIGGSSSSARSSWTFWRAERALGARSRSCELLLLVVIFQHRPLPRAVRRPRAGPARAVGCGGRRRSRGNQEQHRADRRARTMRVRAFCMGPCFLLLFARFGG